MKTLIKNSMMRDIKKCLTMTLTNDEIQEIFKSSKTLFLWRYDAQPMILDKLTERE